MPVTDLHPEYAAHLPEWEMMEQAMGGELAIKADARNLIKPSGHVEAERKNPADTHLYAAYRARAQYQLWVRDGVRAMMGLVARQVPTIELPARIAHMEGQATADGYSLRQLFLRVVKHTLTQGRVLLMVDVDDLGKPFIALYGAATAINWKSRKVRGRDDLSIVVLTEQRPRPGADEFSHDSDTVYRVLDLLEGRLRVRVLNQAGTAVEDERLPTLPHAHKVIDYLPIVFCGANDNGPDVDELPLLTMAKAALADYQLSADYFTALHQTSHPQPWVAGLQDDVELSVTGPSAAWDLGPDGSCGYLEFQGAGIEAVRQAMADQKNSALEAGARVMDMGGVESGEARKTRQDDQHATLHGIVVTAAEAIEQALRYAAERVGVDDVEKAVVFTVVPEFAATVADPLVLRQMQADVLAGGLSWQTYWMYLTSGKLPEHDYEEERGLIDLQGPSLGAMADSGFEPADSAPPAPEPVAGPVAEPAQPVPQPVPQPEPVDLSPVLDAIAAIRIPEPEPVKAPDYSEAFAAVTSQIAALAQRVDAPKDAGFDLTPVNMSIDAMARQIAALESKPAPDYPATVRERVADAMRPMLEAAAKPPEPVPDIAAIVRAELAAQPKPAQQVMLLDPQTGAVKKQITLTYGEDGRPSGAVVEQSQGEAA